MWVHAGTRDRCDTGVSRAVVAILVPSVIAVVVRAVVPGYDEAPSELKRMERHAAPLSEPEFPCHE
jgi:hypothetical protein